MRAVFAASLAVALLLPSAAVAAEKGMAIRSGELRVQPFVDAAKAGAVTPSQPVTIIERRGGWAQVEANGQTGWMRLLNLRLEPSTANAAGGKGKGLSLRPGSLSNPASLLRTGSSGRTVTTGVKGMDEESIRNATVDRAELQELETLAVGNEEARANALKSELKETDVAYLAKGKGK